MTHSKDRQTTAADDAGDRAKIRALPWALSSGMLNSFFALWTFGGSVFVLFLNDRHTTRTAVRSFLNRIAQR